jgi:hypothetical protein
VARFNFLDHAKKPTEVIDAFITRVCASKSDPYKGLYGEAYIAANALKPQVKKVRTSAQSEASHANN